MLSKNDELLYCYSEGYCAEKLNTSINAVQHIRAYYKKHPKRLKEIYCDVLTQDLIENK